MTPLKFAAYVGGVVLVTLSCAAKEAALAPEISGPLPLVIPQGLCDQKVPPRDGLLPPDHPLATQSEPSPELQAKIVAYHQQEQLRSMQTQFCVPVMAADELAASKTTLPSECLKTRDPYAMFNPIHPLADLNRADVQEAVTKYEQAKANMEAVVQKCRGLAGLPAHTLTPDEIQPPELPPQIMTAPPDDGTGVR